MDVMIPLILAALLSVGQAAECSQNCTVFQNQPFFVTVLPGPVTPQNGEATEMRVYVDGVVTATAPTVGPGLDVTIRTVIATTGSHVVEIAAANTGGESATRLATTVSVVVPTDAAPQPASNVHVIR